MSAQNEPVELAVVDAAARVAEYVRQYKLGRGLDPERVASVYTDVTADPAELLVSDLELMARSAQAVEVLLVETESLSTPDGVVHTSLVASFLRAALQGSRWLG